MHLVRLLPHPSGGGLVKSLRYSSLPAHPANAPSGDEPLSLDSLDSLDSLEPDAPVTAGTRAPSQHSSAGEELREWEDEGGRLKEREVWR